MADEGIGKKSFTSTQKLISSDLSLHVSYKITHLNLINNFAAIVEKADFFVFIVSNPLRGEVR